MSNITRSARARERARSTEPLAVVETRGADGWSYRAVVSSGWKPSYVGAAHPTTYYRFDRSWQEVPYSALPKPVYRKLRALIARDLSGAGQTRRDPPRGSFAEALDHARGVAVAHRRPVYVKKESGTWRVAFTTPDAAPFRKVHPDGRHHEIASDPRRRRKPVRKDAALAAVAGIALGSTLTYAAMSRHQEDRRKDPSRKTDRQYARTGKIHAKMHAIARRLDAAFAAGPSARLFTLAVQLRALVDEAKMRGLQIDAGVQRTLASASSLREIARRARGSADPTRPKRCR